MPCFCALTSRARRACGRSCNGGYGQRILPRGGAAGLSGWDEEGLAGGMPWGASWPGDGGLERWGGDVLRESERGGLARETHRGRQTRHIQVARARRARTWPIPPFAPPKDAAPSQGEYFLFVLGSGGHTKEMLMMMDDGTPHQGSCHRRYLISSGDSMSESHLDEYEAAMRRGASAPGTYDKRVVTRARRVHQPLWSTPWTSLLSIVDIFPALLSPPRNGAAKEGPKYPGLIFSNGPATGLPVALAVHLLKVVGVVPHEAMKFVYIESWARISTLSLTGKLLYYTGIADAFYVQHEEVAVKYGVMNAGQMVFNAQRPPPVTSS